MSGYDVISSKKPWWKSTLFKLSVVLVITTVAVVVPIVIIKENKSTNYNIPPIKPPVQESVPSSLNEPSNRRLLNEIDFSFGAQIKDRFFSGEGPTSVYDLLGDIDGRTQSLNLRSVDGDRECLGLAPVEIPINGWPGEDNMTIWVQCYEQLSDNLFLMFGKKDDIVYLYERGQATTATAIITLNPPDHSGEFPCCYQINGGGSDCTCTEGVCTGGGNCRTKTGNDWFSTGSSVGTLTGNSSLAEVNIYFSVGAGWDNEQGESGSRGLMHLVATPQNGYFQASVAGIGLGFCGVQFASNGEKMFFIGSQDGLGGGCLDVNSTCVLGDDLSVETTGCDTDIGFSILPLGRTESSDFLGNYSIPQWNASTWPASGNNVDISDIASSSVLFGPSAIPTNLLGPQHNFS